MRDVRDIQNPKEFEDLCHELLSTEYADYQPIAGEGGDKGIDGFRDDGQIIYQFKFSTYRLRPAAYFADLERVALQKRFREWVLVIPREPTPRLLELGKAKSHEYRLRVTIIGRAALTSVLNKHPIIREKYFTAYAKEATVLRLRGYVASKADIRRLEKKMAARKTTKLRSTPPGDSLTPVHRKEITDAAQAVVRSSRGQVPFSQVFGMLKNEFSVDHWHWIPDSMFPDVIAWLHNFKYGVRDQYRGQDSATRLKGVIQSQKRQLQLSDKDYRNALMSLTGQNSTRRLDLRQLRTVYDYFNLLTSQTKS